MNEVLYEQSSLRMHICASFFSLFLLFSVHISFRKFCSFSFFLFFSSIYSSHTMYSNTPNCTLCVHTTVFGLLFHICCCPRPLHIFWLAVSRFHLLRSYGPTVWFKMCSEFFSRIYVVREKKTSTNRMNERTKKSPQHSAMEGTKCGAKNAKLDFHSVQFVLHLQLGLLDFPMCSYFMLQLCNTCSLLSWRAKKCFYLFFFTFIFVGLWRIFLIYVLRQNSFLQTLVTQMLFVFFSSGFWFG